MVCARTQELRFQFSLSAIFTMRKTATPHIPRPKPTHLMALSSGICLRLMPFRYTIPATNDTTSRIATKLILIAYPHWFILLFYGGGLFVSLFRGESSSISEPYPPGTQVVEPSSSNNDVLRLDTVVNIPIEPTLSPQYRIEFDDGTSQTPIWIALNFSC